MKNFKEKLERAIEIRVFYKLAKKYGFKEGNPEIIVSTRFTCEIEWFDSTIGYL